VVVVLAAFSSAALHFYGFGYKEFFISVRLGSRGEPFSIARVPQSLHHR
jgi:hypothetical protein